MRFMLEGKFPHDHGNAVLKDPQFGDKLHALLKEMGAEQVYFCPVGGKRGFYIVLSFDDPSLIPVKIEPLFFWLQAEVTLTPVFDLADMEKAGPSIGAAMMRWG